MFACRFTLNLGHFARPETIEACGFSPEILSKLRGFYYLLRFGYYCVHFSDCPFNTGMALLSRCT
uniref:Uncharacterized protein n=1 Tax=Arundo donax TaxID=35708 RepID=A0A0A9C198_ARUDO